MAIITGQRNKEIRKSFFAGTPELAKQIDNLPGVSKKLFPNCKLLSTANELFELELANLEYELLSHDELLERSAFFESINGKLTSHFKLCSSSSRTYQQEQTSQTQAYFEDGKFSTGYANHGLFPYRGKFHPQLIKAILNIIGIKKSETILDPMCGSGTANLEAALMGINSVAIDQSPFCRFMTKTKFEALTIDSKLLKGLSGKADEDEEADDVLWPLLQKR
jgi:hypothetical protein